MKCVLVVPDGMGIRNFLHSRFLDYFGPDDDVVVWHALPASVLSDSAPDSGRPSSPAGRRPIVFRPLPPYREGLTERVLRLAKVYGQLYWRQESGTEQVLRVLRRTSRPLTAAINFGARLLGRIAGTSGYGLARLDWLHAAISGRARRVQSFETVLASLQPDIVFCTHQRASRAVPVMLAARRLGIPTATFVYSWDNLPKGRMAVHADHFFVWSDHMKNELLGYYPEVSADRVHIVGTPQFEPYFVSASIEPRQRFLERLGLDANRPTVCFSGCDLTSSPYDPVFLDDLASALENVPIAERPQIVFRRCPVESDARYRWVLDRHPEIAVSDPLWQLATGSDWTGAMPTAGDSVLLANLVHHCDLVVNMGSTMALDFALLGKPGIFLAYEPEPAEPARAWSARECYTLPHLKVVQELQPVHWAHSKAELSSVVMHALAHPDEKRDARERWVERLARAPLDQASRRCYETLRAVARRN